MMTFKLLGRGASKVLLFPGLMGTQTAFDAMLAYADLDACQYVVPDFRGYGAARHVDGPFTLRQIVADAAEIVAGRRWTSFVCGGHSVGALAAQMMALACPERVAGLISIAGMNAAGGSRETARRQFLRDAASDGGLRVAMAASGRVPPYASGFARELVRQTWDEIAPAAFAGYGHDMGETDITADVAGCTLPMLLIVGECDSRNTAELAKSTTMQWFANTTLEVLPGVGHYPLMEAPVQTMASVERFAVEITGR